MFRALVIEDQKLMRLALMEELRLGIENCAVLGAETLEIALSALHVSSFNLIIIDPGLPGFDPMAPADRLEVIDRVIKAAPDALYIVITGSDDALEADAMRKRGIAGYLAKTDWSRGS